MNVGIIGAGFTGLAAGYYLSKKGHQVTIIEKEKSPGGLAIGYREEGWKWSLESHYHHWFTNDKSILSLAQEINHRVIIKRPKTSSFVEGNIYQLDSPLSLLRFPKLSFVDKIRTGLSLSLLKFNPYWKPLENFYAEPYLKKTMGEKAYKKIWEPLMKNKLGRHARYVSLAWFWARIYKRTPSLAYPEGGFLEFANHLENIIKKRGGIFYYNADVIRISSDKHPKIAYKDSDNNKTNEKEFDTIIVTLPSPLFTKLTPSLPKLYSNKLNQIINIGAMNLILRLDKSFLSDGTYWLNMCDKNSSILAVVEHTNYMDRKNYNNEHIVYLGNYLEIADKKYSMSSHQLLDLYDPWLKKINPDYKKSLINYRLFRAPFAQPIIPLRYSKKVPGFKTPLKKVYLANIQQVYPWDRGTNYAVELGRKVTDIIS